MKLKEIIKLATRVCNLSYADSFFASAETIAVRADSTIQRFILCANLALEEIFCTHTAAFRTTVVTVQSDGAISVDNLGVCKVVGLQDEQGNAVAYSVMEKGLLTKAAPGCKLNLRYVPLPKWVSWDADVTLPPNVTQNTLLFGTLWEYYLQMGDYAAAEIWHARFSQCAMQSARHKGEMRLPKMRWLS